MKTVTGILELIDAHKKTHFNEHEFCMFLYTCENAQPDDAGAIYFYAADTNYSGTIDKAELKVIFGKIGANDDQKEIDSIHAKFVDNKDDTISYDQFVQMLCYHE